MTYLRELKQWLIEDGPNARHGPAQIVLQLVPICVIISNALGGLLVLWGTTSDMCYVRRARNRDKVRTRGSVLGEVSCDEFLAINVLQNNLLPPTHLDVVYVDSLRQPN